MALQGKSRPVREDTGRYHAGDYHPGQVTPTCSGYGWHKQVRLVCNVRKLPSPEHYIQFGHRET